jgi:predicted RNA binding protein YcfA (HicA-like mRNA interferase family)
MKLPRDISGSEFAQKLSRLGYTITRQTGSHIRLTTNQNGEHHITIPSHQSLRIGTLASILNDVATHLDIEKSKLIEELFGK